MVIFLVGVVIKFTGGGFVMQKQLLEKFNSILKEIGHTANLNKCHVLWGWHLEDIESDPGNNGWGHWSNESLNDIRKTFICKYIDGEYQDYPDFKYSPVITYENGIYKEENVQSFLLEIPLERCLISLYW
jgi:hypothetical protein